MSPKPLVIVLSDVAGIKSLAPRGVYDCAQRNTHSGHDCAKRWPSPPQEGVGA
jgi:hypothetical protein